jgi:hypothetical protein
MVRSDDLLIEMEQKLADYHASLVGGGGDAIHIPDDYHVPGEPLYEPDPRYEADLYAAMAPLTISTPAQGRVLRPRRPARRQEYEYEYHPYDDEYYLQRARVRPRRRVYCTHDDQRDTDNDEYHEHNDEYYTHHDQHEYDPNNGEYHKHIDEYEHVYHPEDEHDDELKLHPRQPE